MKRVGRYEILSELGRGGSGVVYAGRDLIDGRDVAIKEISESAAHGSRGGEAAALRRIGHPGVLRVLDTLRQQGRSFIVMERVDGDSLQTLLERRGTLDVEQAVALACQAARALAAIHRQGIVHRDIKPANLLIAADGSLKIADFGLARCSGDDEEPGTFLGTPAYVAPERWRGASGDARSDLYALGVVLFRMLTGQRPHQGASVQELARSVVQTPAPPPSSLRPGLPAGLDAICARLLARDPAERFASGEEVARSLGAVVLEDLECSAGGQPAAAAGPLEQTWRKLPRPATRRSSRIWAAAAMLAGAVLLIVALRGVSPSPAAASAPLASGVFQPPNASARSPTDSSLESSAAAAAAGDSAAVEPRAVEPPPAWKPARLPPKGVVGRYAGAGEVARASRSTSPVPESPPPTAAPTSEAVEPEPTSARWPAPPEAVERTGRRAAEALRGVVEISHPLDEGLVELRIDGRRRALARIGLGASFGPRVPVLLAYEVPAGAHRFEVRVLSASAGVDAELKWKSAGDAAGFRSRRLRLTAGGERWELAGR